MKKKITACFAIMLLAFTLTACGGDDSKKETLDGYYTMYSPSGKAYGLVIDGDTAIYETNANNYPSMVSGNVESAEEGVDLYFEASGWMYEYEPCEFNPYHAKLSDDGTRLYLSADSDDWITDTYLKVSESAYETFRKENFPRNLEK